MRLVDMFEAVKGNAEEKLAGQVSLTENWLVAKGYTSLKRESRGTSNTFYFKEGEPVVFVSYYSKNKESDNIYKMSRPNVQKILYKNVQLVCLF